MNILLIYSMNTYKLYNINITNKIFIETTRSNSDEKKGERKKSRKDQLLELLKSKSDPETNEKYVPYCVEPSVGVERLFLMVCCDAYDKEKVVMRRIS